MNRLGLLVLVLVQVAVQTGTAMAQESVTARFRLAVEGSPPPDATFFVMGSRPNREGAASLVRLRLQDPDGDGTYTGTEQFDRGEQTTLRFVQGFGTRTEDGVTNPGGDYIVPLFAPGGVLLRNAEDSTVRAQVAFDARGNPTQESVDPEVVEAGVAVPRDVPNAGGGGTSGSRAILVLGAASAIVLALLVRPHGRRPRLR